MSFFLHSGPQVHVRSLGKPCFLEFHRLLEPENQHVESWILALVFEAPLFWGVPVSYSHFTNGPKGHVRTPSQFIICCSAIQKIDCSSREGQACRESQARTSFCCGAELATSSLRLSLLLRDWLRRDLGSLKGSSRGCLAIWWGIY